MTLLNVLKYKLFSRRSSVKSSRTLRDTEGFYAIFPDIRARTHSLLKNTLVKDFCMDPSVDIDAIAKTLGLTIRKVAKPISGKHAHLDGSVIFVEGELCPQQKSLLQQEYTKPV